MDSRWYLNSELLVAAKEKYGSLEEAAYAIGGVHPSTLQKQWNLQRLGRLRKGPVPKPPSNEEALRELYEQVYGTK